ncbi:hypothetical protein [Synechocystis sp. PCC 7339]|uniref:hypothetical protein n=1 Tax=Synechocystis sp. PCC 7339 TaxID=2782213 RepID=UPI001CBD13A5|nr:hypothetical protein [Synechocystis sp. PCC 7339]
MSPKLTKTEQTRRTRRAILDRVRHLSPPKAMPPPTRYINVTLQQYLGTLRQHR